MSENHANQKIESDTILGNGYEPLAVSLMTLFLWMFFLSVGYEYLF